MRKIKYCFSHLKRLVNDAKLPGNQLPDVQEDKSAGSVIGNEELKKLKDLLQQRDNEINILVNMLKKEKRKTQDALRLSASSKEISATESSYDLKNMETEQMLPVILEIKSNSHSKSQGLGDK
ncbi:PREDICTED: kinesin-like protein KIF6 [Thamnophis sirtalis]|uniref:Kinesin-like protein KIF6 n=1 Tax=Thamnophis sirtalis TaxID=35019 RepID=A0A6I9XCN0_9SAUR|nr:PREDICTED: kinesin-like protein KIF6 [Thamnophis sirtalis]